MISFESKSLHLKCLLIKNCRCFVIKVRLIILYHLSKSNLKTGLWFRWIFGSAFRTEKTELFNFVDCLRTSAGLQKFSATELDREPSFSEKLKKKFRENYDFKEMQNNFFYWEWNKFPAEPTSLKLYTCLWSLVSFSKTLSENSDEGLEPKRKHFFLRKFKI